METEKIIDQMNTTFKVTAIPVWALKEFKEYCKAECGNVYAVGIIQLLKTKKQYENLIPLFASLQTQIDELKEKLKLNESRAKPKTFE